jgi:hypothetical protein
MSDDLTHADNIAVAKELQTIARMIDKRLERATGGKRVPFSLFTWGGHRSQYVANTDRDQAKTAMEETLSRWAEDDGPIHKTAN